MARSERQIDELRERLSGLLADWGAEISAVMSALENQQSLVATHTERVQALEAQVNELPKLRQRVRERDLALDHLTTRAKERDARFAELENEHRKARARIEELERQLGASQSPAQQQKSVPHEEIEAMRAELVARKSLVKSLRTDAERSKTLEKELAEHREIIATMKVSLDRHARTIAELRLGSDGWERKYRRLAESGNDKSSRHDPTMEVDGGHTIVIDMTESLREARDERRRKSDKR